MFQKTLKDEFCANMSQAHKRTTALRTETKSASENAGSRPERGTNRGEKWSRRGAPAVFFAPRDSPSEECEPLYITTLPEPLQKETPPKPKGILKNGVKPRLPPIPEVRRASALTLSSPTKKETLLRPNDVRHFDLDIKEPMNNCGKTSDENIALSFHDSPQKFDPKNPQKKYKLRVEMADHMKRRAIDAARIESMAGISHLIVIVMCIIILIVLAQVTSAWELKIRRCPLYVRTSKDWASQWGNEKLMACHYTAYMPALILVMSLSLILLHGGVLYAWRSGNETSVLLVSKTYPKILFFIEFLELVIAISVAGVILDGVRQTCLSFQLNPWPDERPENCKDGYDERDSVYGISKTYPRLIAAMVASITCVCMLFTTSVFYLIRINPPCSYRQKS